VGAAISIPALFLRLKIPVQPTLPKEDAETWDDFMSCFHPLSDTEKSPIVCSNWRLSILLLSVCFRHRVKAPLRITHRSKKFLNSQCKVQLSGEMTFWMKILSDYSPWVFRIVHASFSSFNSCCSQALGVWSLLKWAAILCWAKRVQCILHPLNLSNCSSTYKSESCNQENSFIIS
jgi:hypothetical protein